jgi:hypothetical protein
MLIPKAELQYSDVQLFVWVPKEFYTFSLPENNKACPINVIRERRKSPTGFAVLVRRT